MGHAAGGIGFYTQIHDPIVSPKIIGYPINVNFTTLVKIEKTIFTGKWITGTGNSLLRQQGTENPGPGSKCRLHPFHQTAIQQTLSVAGRLAVDNTEIIHLFFLGKSKNFAGGGSSAKRTTGCRPNP